jgi:hypothetical protein
MPEDWAADLQLTQEQIGNAVPLGLAFRVGSSIAACLRPHLIARSSGHKAVDEAATGHLLRSPARHGPRLSQREIRLVAFNRLAVRRLEWKRWCWLQRAQLQRALARLQETKKVTRRDLRLWRAAGLRSIANSHDGCSDELIHFDQHPVDLLWWQWRENLWPLLRDGQRLPLLEEPVRCFKPNAPSAIHPNVDCEFARLRTTKAWLCILRRALRTRLRQDQVCERYAWCGQEGFPR